ncbi:MAG: ATP-binding cassette domain-containing protein [Clostridia bacterium]|nr:ATP-binding cassette domain-containing protein [Clostridia bacterium]
MEYVIETHGLYKRYGHKLAVNDVSAHVTRGDIYGLIGKNGAGKTSLMKLILGITYPTDGDVTLFGGENVNQARRRIGSLIEEPGLFKACSARENLLRFSMLFGTDKKEIDGILELVGLADTGNKPAKAFSQGMKQRLGIAIALLGNPEVLVLDEPINGLDPAGIKEIRDTILRLNHETGVTFIISSHLLDELAKVVTSDGIIAEGKLVEEISAAKLTEKCSRQAKIAVSDGEKAIRILKEKYADLNAELRGDGIYLFNHTDKTAEINTCLVTAGIAVSELTRSGQDFEQFFIERLGD